MAKMSADKGEFALVKGDEDGAVDPNESRKNRRRRKTCIVVSVVVVIVLIIVAFIGGYLLRRALNIACKKPEEDSGKHSIEESDLGFLHKEAVNGITKERIEENFR